MARSEPSAARRKGPISSYARTFLRREGRSSESRVMSLPSASHSQVLLVSISLEGYAVEMFWSKQNETVLVEDGYEMCGKVMDRGIVEVTGWPAAMPAPARGLMRVIQNKTYEQPKSATCAVPQHIPEALFAAIPPIIAAPI